MIPIRPTLLIEERPIMSGLLKGTLQRFGGSIRIPAGMPGAGRFVRHLAEAPSLTQQLSQLPIPIQAFQSVQLAGISKSLSTVLSLSQVAAAASVLNVGISAVGFAYMGYKLHKLQKSVDALRLAVDRGFEEVRRELAELREELRYVRALVEAGLIKQDELAASLTDVHELLLLREVAELRAALLEMERWPDSDPREVIRIASRVRMVLGDQARRFGPASGMRGLLLGDVAFRGWAVASMTESRLLAAAGHRPEAARLALEEARELREVGRRWARDLLSSPYGDLQTAYRFATPAMREDVKEERILRVARLSPFDGDLPARQGEQKAEEAELEMSVRPVSEFDARWRSVQLGHAEFLDGVSEICERLDSSAALLKDVDECSADLRALLPGKHSEPGLYTLDLSNATQP